MEHFEPNTALSHPYNDVHLSGNDTKEEEEEIKEENVQTRNNINDISEHYCVSESSKSSENRNDDIHVDEDEFASSPRILSPIQAADKEEELEELEVEEEKECEEHYINTKEGVDLYNLITKPAAPHHQITDNNKINYNNTFTSNLHSKSNERETSAHHVSEEEEEMVNELELQTTPITRKSNDLVWDKSHFLQSLHSDNFVTPNNKNKKTDSCSSSNNNNRVAFPPCPLTPASKFIAQSMKTPLVHNSETHQKEDNTDDNTNKVAACHPYLINPTTFTNNDNNKFHISNEECRHTQENINLENTTSEQMPDHEEENKICNNNENNLEEMAHNVRHRQRAKSYSGMTNFLFNNNHTNHNNLPYESMQQMCSSTPRPPRCPSSERSGPHLQRELFTFHVHQPIRESQTNSNNNNNRNTNIITPLTEFNSSHNANLQDNNHHYYNSPIHVISNHNSNTNVNTCTDNNNIKHVEENNVSSDNSNNNKVNKEIISPSHVSLNSPMMQMAAVWVDAPVLPPSLSNTTNNKNNELYSTNSIMPSLQSNTLSESNMELGYSSAYRQNKRRTTPRSRSTSQPPSPMTNTLVMMPEQQLFTHCEPNINHNDNNVNSVHEKVNVNTLSVQTEPVRLSQLDVSNDTNNKDNNYISNLHRIQPPEEKHLMSEIAHQQHTIIHELKAMNAGLQNLHCDCVNEKNTEKESSADKTENVHTVQSTSNISNNANESLETHKDLELHAATVISDVTSKSNKDDKHRNNEALFEPPSYLNTLSSLSSSHAEFQDKVEENETVSSSSSSVAVSPHVNKAPCKTEPKTDSQSTNEETMLHNKKDEGAEVEQKVNNHDKKDNTSQITLADLMQALERARQRARYIRDKTTKKEEESSEANHI